RSIGYGDASYHAFLDLVDAYVERHKLCLPAEQAARVRRSDPPCITAPVRQLDTKDARLGSVIWATGYAFDFSWIDLPVLSASGEPKHQHGVSPVAGV